MKITTSLKTSLGIAALGLSFFSVSALAATDLTGSVQEFYATSPILTHIESLAEDSFDSALANDHSKVRKAALNIQSSWTTFRSQAKSAGASNALLASMDSSVSNFVKASHSNLTKFEVARAANRVSGNMEGLFSLYHPSTPPAIMTLDYFGRELVIDGLENDFARATSQLSELVSRWNVLKASAEATTGGPALVAKYDASLQAINSAISARDANALVSSAKGNLEITDDIEKLFGN